jgi:acid stress-induced BolA-like protein IbaG/YrbA
MELKEELTRLLEDPDSRIHSPELDLEEHAGGKVGGFVISDTFAGMPQIDRQNLLWGYLDKRLGRDKVEKIIALVTVTPEEAQDE